MSNLMWLWFAPVAIACVFVVIVTAKEDDNGGED
jgi:hypothetical protein